MVAFILHLGNVTFDDEEGNAVISSDEMLNIIDTVCNDQCALHDLPLYHRIRLVLAAYHTIRCNTIALFLCAELLAGNFVYFMCRSININKTEQNN